MAFAIHSPAFGNGEAIAREYTCEGNDISPPLQWAGAPGATRGFVLLVVDPDAPDPAAPRRTWVHWVVFNIPPDADGLPEGVTAATLPDGASQGRNDWGREVYGGPCPPIGRHRYFFRLYALDVLLVLSGKPTLAAVEAAMQGHVLAEAELMGTYQKAG